VGTGTAARQAMIQAAERLIAEQGIAACSLREVQLLAGQRNKSAAHYHFGSRDGLVEAIVETRMAPINADRLARIEALDAEGRGHDLRALVEVLVDPLATATLGRPGSNYARFLAQVIGDPKTSALVARHLLAESFRTVRDRLADLLRDVPEELQALRVDRAVGLVLISLASWEGTPGSPARVADLVDACVAVLEAPLSERTRSALEADAPSTAADTDTAREPGMPS
jgi:AcrR family transcriptional regulator